MTDETNGPRQRRDANDAPLLWLRALLSFLALPGVVAGLLPPYLASVDPRRVEGSPAGAAVLVVGLILLLWCVRDFFVSGRGTLAPWDPPRNLVVVGLYRYVRNPMYVGVLTLVTGWGWLAGSPVVVGYAGVLAVAFHLRVVAFEEPWLARTFGEDWGRYRANVPRWIPRLRAWRG